MNPVAAKRTWWITTRLVIVASCMVTVGCGPAAPSGGPPPTDNTNANAPPGPGNHPPAVNAGADQTVDAGASVTLDGSGSSDPDGDPVSFAWQQKLGTTVALSSASAPTVTFTAPANGATLRFELSVSDGRASSVGAVSVAVRPVESSAQVDELVQRSVTEDPPVMGDFADDWLVDVGNDLPQQTPEDAEYEEFVEKFERTRVPVLIEEDLAAGATRTATLEIAGASGLAGLAQWIGTVGPLEVNIALDGSTLATGTAYRMGTDRGGSYLRVTASAGGVATLSVTNTTERTVKVRIIFGATEL